MCEVYSYITNLNLSKNEINEIEQIIYLNKLTKLDLSNNEIVLLPDKLFQNLRELQILSFENNKIQKLSPYIQLFKHLIQLNILIMK